MSKIIVTPKNEKHLNKLLDDKIDAVLLSIENLSINSEYYISLNKLREILPKIKEKNKEVFISVNIQQMTPEHCIIAFVHVFVTYRKSF